MDSPQAERSCWNLLCEKKLSRRPLTEDEAHALRAMVGQRCDGLELREAIVLSDMALRAVFRAAVENTLRITHPYECAARGIALGSFELALTFDAEAVARDVCLALAKRDYTTAYQAASVLRVLIVCGRATDTCNLFCEQAIRHLDWLSGLPSIVSELELRLFQHITSSTDELDVNLHSTTSSS